MSAGFSAKSSTFSEVQSSDVHTQNIKKEVNTGNALTQIYKYIVTLSTCQMWNTPLTKHDSAISNVDAQVIHFNFISKQRSEHKIRQAFQCLQFPPSFAHCA